MKLEINGMLDDPQYGIKNYNTFEKVIIDVVEFYYKYLGQEAMNGPKLFVDNAISVSGYTPVILPVFDEYLLIKLHIEEEDSESRVAFQFSHELMHYVYYVKYGIKKELADDREEAICTAASLCVLAEMYSGDLDRCVRNICEEETKRGYQIGEKLAKEIGYDFGRLIVEGEKIFDTICENEDCNNV